MSSRPARGPRARLGALLLGLLSLPFAAPGPCFLGAAALGAGVGACNGCAAVDTRIRVEALRGPLERVLARTGAYAAADTGLAPDERAALEQLVAQLRGLLVKERLAAGELEAAGWAAVEEWHDEFVATDPALDELEVRVHLGDSEAVRELAAAARGE